MRFWLLYYAIFGPKYTRSALLLFALGMALFFFCFVHEAFDSPRALHSVPTAYRPRPIKLGLAPAVPSKPFEANHPLRTLASYWCRFSSAAPFDGEGARPQHGCLCLSLKLLAANSPQGLLSFYPQAPHNSQRQSLDNVCVNNNATLQSNRMSTDLPKPLPD
jgi:hypothetical protein